VYALKQRLTIPASRRVELELPADTPEGPAEVIVLCQRQPEPSKPQDPVQALKDLQDAFSDMTPEEWEAFDKAVNDARKTDQFRRGG
jgi:hypothetical protein